MRFGDHAWFLILRKIIWSFSNLMPITHLGQIPFSTRGLSFAGLVCRQIAGLLKIKGQKPFSSNSFYLFFRLCKCMYPINSNTHTKFKINLAECLQKTNLHWSVCSTELKPLVRNILHGLSTHTISYHSSYIYTGIIILAKKKKSHYLDLILSEQDSKLYQFTVATPLTTKTNDQR